MPPQFFHKYEGLGNDFVLVEVEREDEVSPAAARTLCDRRLGVGADGVIVLLPSTMKDAAARMRIINADGSVPEMCGNGLRCAVLHVARRRTLRACAMTFETDAGLRSCVIGDVGESAMVTVDMGVVRVTGETRIVIGGESWDLVLANAGNPHAITTREVTREQIEAVGPRIATDARFAAGTNVEFARYSPGGIDLVVWERGVGITLACGTGACAATAVGVAKGLVPSGDEITVHLLGGDLHVTMRPDGRAIMRGQARHVFSGRLAKGAFVAYEEEEAASA